MICEGNVKKFCCEDISKIENYEKAMTDTIQTWDCHHRMELIKTGAVVDSTMQDLIDWGIYYSRPADELIFLTRNEHQKLHKSIIGGCTYGKNAREHSLAVRKSKKEDKIRKFREWMEIHCNEVDLESKGRYTKEGKISKREAAKLIGISYDEFRNYIALYRKERN